MNPEKKLTYFLDEGGFLQAATPSEVINALRQHYKLLDMDDGDFMNEVARRYQKRDLIIRTDTILHFVYDLMNTGAILPPVPFPEREVLNYAKLYMEVAVPEFLPTNHRLEVLIDFYPVDKQITGLRVRVRGFWEFTAVQVERVFSPAELVTNLGSWKAKAAQFSYQVQHGS